ncbi:hypothetical protein ACTVH1_09710 [Gluconobacter cerinus]
MTAFPARQLETTLINPDVFLETDTGRIWMPERNVQAWQCAFAALQRLLSTAPGAATIVVCGLQGAGKSTWVATQLPQSKKVYFNAALPGAKHRQPIIDIARSADAMLEAVRTRVSLDTTLAQNALRAPDKKVPKKSILSVHSLLEPPTIKEGFGSVRIIDVANPSDRGTKCRAGRAMAGGI